MYYSVILNTVDYSSQISPAWRNAVNSGDILFPSIFDGIHVLESDLSVQQLEAIPEIDAAFFRG